MKLFKPPWINHDGMPICSIDIHPDGTRVATGGQGVDTGRIVIWNMEPVLYEDKELDPNCPKMLCQLDNHLACVNSVRWNSTGNFLASGGDDKLVMIWSISKSGGIPGIKGANVECWRCVATLRGHHGDVLDTAWSPHDHWLATCSIDNTVIVWRMDSKPPGLLTVLRGHTGLVKGVSWDPVGKYLSSQSDDKTVRIWRTSDWKQDAVIKEPFVKCSGTTLVLRLSWSPDGQYLVTAHAMNGRVPTAQIIDRDGWTHDKDFVGHHMAITTVKFNRSILDSELAGRVTRSCACVLGSRDRSLSVWLTGLNRPVLVLHNLFTSPVLDVTWGPPLCLMSCSGDGTVAYLAFSPEELGKPISQEDKDKLFEKLYGKSSCEPEFNVALLENPELLELKSCESSKPLPTPNQQQTPTTPVRPAPVSPFSQNSLSCSARHLTPPTTKQIETRRADGKRRITPIFIPPPSSDTHGDDIAPFNSDHGSQPFSSSVQTKSKIVVELIKELPPTPSVTESPARPTTAPPDPSPSLYNLNKGGFAELLAYTEKVESRKRNAASSCEDSVPVKVPAMAINIALREHVLPVLQQPPNTFSCPLSDTSDILAMENNIKGQGPVAVLKYLSTKANRTLWSFAFGSNIAKVVTCGPVVAVSLTTPYLYLLRLKDGSLISCPLALPSPVALLTSTKDSLVVVTCDGQLYSWSLDSSELSTTLTAVCLDPLVASSKDSDVSIKDCYVMKSKEPMLILSNGKAFMYSIKNKMWSLLNDSGDAVNRSTIAAYRNSSTARSLSFPLTLVQSSSDSHFASTSGSFRRNGLFSGSTVCTSSYLEGQLARSITLESPVEYKRWLFIFVRFLMNHGMDSRLRHICEDLLGPAHSTSSLSSWKTTVLGLNKHDLLSEILLEVKGNVKLQRLYLEFSEQLANVKKQR